MAIENAANAYHFDKTRYIQKNSQLLRRLFMCSREF